MSEQFPNKSAESSKEAFEELLAVLESIKDVRIPMWCANWMREACEEKIIKAEQDYHRHQYFGRQADAGKTMQFLAQYKEAMRLIMALQTWTTMLSVEESVASMREFLQNKYGKPPVETTATTGETSLTRMRKEAK